MFKQALLLLGAMSLATPTLATELTNPFYVPSKGKVASVTSLETSRLQRDTNEGKTRDYNRAVLDEALAYGITDSFALTGSIGNAWQKNKTVGVGSTKDNSNVDFTVGGLYNVLSEGPTKLQVKALYGQKESESHDNGGAYKYAKAGVKAGYDLGYILPYAAADIEVPVSQSKYGNDKNTYSATLGAYKLWCKTFALDGGLTYTHKEAFEDTTWKIGAEFSYFITPSWTAGVYANYVLDGTTKYNGDIDGETVGLRLRTTF